MSAAVLRLRVELEDVEPSIWRAIEVPASLTLDTLHLVVQGAMGWTDSHLHRFSVGRRWDPEARWFVTAEDLSEGEDGVPEASVQVGDLLRRVGDELLYAYDFGDGWNHVLRLEATSPSADGGVRCLDGRRACPPEDCGGPPGYDELLARWPESRRVAADRFVPGQAQGLIDLLLESAGARRPSRGFSRSADSGPASSPRRDDPLPDALRDLLERSLPGGDGALRALLVGARLDRPVLVDVVAAQRTIAPVAAVVEHIGVRGVPLTSAGYLRPDDVEAIAHALSIGDEWIGSLNREVHTYPVLAFRQALQRAGVLRVARGRVHASRTAAGLVHDPVGLWWHLAERLPVGRGAERDAGLLVLLQLAGGDDGGAPVVAAAMAALGWARRDGAPLMSDDVAEIAEHTAQLVRRCGAYLGSSRPGERTTVASPDGVALARAALQTWRRTPSSAARR